MTRVRRTEGLQVRVCSRRMVKIAGKDTLDESA